MAESNKNDPITIKKYANRRLYNTSTSKYVTLDDLAQMVKSGDEFVVVDAKSGDDITRPVLTQIIFEEEAKGENLLPVSFLRQLIQFYGDSLQSMVPNYLEASMDAFSSNQDRMRDYVESAVGRSMYPLSQWEELGRQNMAMFERAFQIFTPRGAEEENAGDKPSAPKSGEAAKSDDDKLNDLQSQIEKLRRQLDDLSR
jgi:polyhydroxyalkanoate synthesis repressor PhaR